MCRRRTLQPYAANGFDIMNRIYSAYGAHGHEGRSLSGYAGDRIDAITGWYILGARGYSPLLRRFLGPDAMSPFDAGGINRYAYCSGDPINRIDPSGRVWTRWFGGLTRRPSEEAPPSVRASIEQATASTPDTMNTAAAASSDATTVASGIPSGSLAGPAVPGDVVLGQLAAGTSDRPVGVNAPPPAKRARTDDRSVGGTTLPAGQALSSTVTSYGGRFGHWSRRAPRRERSGQRGSYIWTTDTALDETGARDLIDELANRRQLTKITVYSGYEGVRSGDNWDPATGLPRYASAGYTELERRHMPSIAPSTEVQFVDLGTTHRDEVVRLLNRRGIHVVSISFGNVDEMVLDALNAGANPLGYRGVRLLEPARSRHDGKT